MGRKKVDRTDKIMLSFEGTIPLKERLQRIAKEQNITVSKLIRKMLEQSIEERNII